MSTIYGDYVAPAVTDGGRWHIQGVPADHALCGKSLRADRRRMELHISLVECSQCKDVGERTVRS